MVPALRALEPNWETSLDLRKEDELSQDLNTGVQGVGRWE